MCDACGHARGWSAIPTGCPRSIDRAELRRRHGMWRFRSFLPLLPGEEPITLGEGDTPLLRVGAHRCAAGLARPLGQGRGRQPDRLVQGPRHRRCGDPRRSRGSRAVRAADRRQRRRRRRGIRRAGRAARPGLRARARPRAPSSPRSSRSAGTSSCSTATSATAARRPAPTPRRPARSISPRCASHIGSRARRRWAWSWPAARLDAAGRDHLPDRRGHRAHRDVEGVRRAAGRRLGPRATLPRMYTVQSTAARRWCGRSRPARSACEPWPEPWTVASGLRVPGPFGGALMLRALRETGGGAVAVDDADLVRRRRRRRGEKGVDSVARGRGRAGRPPEPSVPAGTSAGGAGGGLQHRGGLALSRPGGFASGLSHGHIYKSMADGRFAILDPAAGISGDMLLGALVAAGAPADWLRGLPARLGVAGRDRGDARWTAAACWRPRSTCVLPGGSQEPPAEPVHRLRPSHHAHHDHQPDHATAHVQGPHRHIGELIADDRAARRFRPGCVSGRCAPSGCSARRRAGCTACRRTQVALHEVGAVDALIDIVGGIEGFERSASTRIFNRPVGVGRVGASGPRGHPRARAGHRAPAGGHRGRRPTDRSSGEAVTPTGAVLLRVLSEGAPPSRWRPVAGGAWGAGGRDRRTYPTRSG